MQYDVIVIGGGIVGLATALTLVERNPTLKLCILEKEVSIAKHQTGNNSGVIHSGIYYEPNSLKAQNCKRGYDLLLGFCNDHSINYDLCGKIIVATNEKEKVQIERIYNRGLENGLEGLQILTSDEIKEIEPNCVGVQAIRVPQAGIIDYKEVAKKMLEILKSKNVVVKYSSRALKITLMTDDVVEVQTSMSTEKTSILINCCGLYSDKMYTESTGKKAPYKILPFRGEYYKLKNEAEHLVNGLIYPVPNPEFPFLGVHFTKMIHGGVEAGPNAVLAFAKEGYKKTDISLKDLCETFTYKGFHSIVRRYWKDGFYEMYRSYSKRAFVKAMQTLVPKIKSSDVIRGGAGVRAQAVYPNGDMIDDFVIEFDGPIINVCNAPSPAATSSLSIGITIADGIKNQKIVKT